MTTVTHLRSPLGFLIDFSQLTGPEWNSWSPPPTHPQTCSPHSPPHLSYWQLHPSSSSSQNPQQPLGHLSLSHLIFHLPHQLHLLKKFPKSTSVYSTAPTLVQAPPLSPGTLALSRSGSLSPSYAPTVYSRYCAQSDGVTTQVRAGYDNHLL